MDRIPRLVDADGGDSLERAMTEVETAIEMVVRGVAASVRLCNLAGANDAAFYAAARAQASGVAFSLLRDSPGSPTMIIGPRVVGPA